MSHMVETMFYVRNKPWHGLGLEVGDALTSYEALIAAGLDWEVIQRPVYVEGVKVPNYKANVRSSDNSVLGIVTDRYKIVQNREAFEFTDSLINDDVRYETAGSLAAGRRVWLLAKMPETMLIDDKVEPYLVFTNSHDGTGAIKVAMTPIRVVCNNTLNLALKNAQRSWSAKHVGDIQSKLEEAKRTLQLANEYMKKLNDKAHEMANDPISDAEFNEFLEQLFPEPSGDNVTDRKIENIKLLRNNLSKVYYHTEDIKKFNGTKYGVINAVSDFVTHSEPLRKSSTYKENLFKSVIDGNPIIDKAYELLAA